ncbi:hypothetical protein [Methylobacterium radiodurans]|uniref:Uncharacterized protein n=1 Tax=Methylobacterium radiodurans TaxID=2202828 RepID=A0A2U8VWB8_9HYPH|nr:hypothetical protein [Methylobacterium radiodurans]AWN38075.1 hypothetical protein DK427_21970 [Methylobacterium radiodurans]
MTRSASLAAALALGLAMCGSAQAQSVGAPAGREPATAAGGTQGIAGKRNVERAFRQGDAVRAPRGLGVPVKARQRR